MMNDSLDLLFKIHKALYNKAIIHSQCNHTLVLVSYMCNRLTETWQPICSTNQHPLTFI